MLKDSPYLRPALAPIGVIFAYKVRENFELETRRGDQVSKRTSKQIVDLMALRSQQIIAETLFLRSYFKRERMKRPKAESPGRYQENRPA